MKIRIQGNTIRIRLNEKETEALKNGSAINSYTFFPSGEIAYILESGGDNSADFNERKMHVIVSKAWVSEWQADDGEVIRFEVSANEDKKLSILVEKDMKV